MPVPIILFAFKRAGELKQTITALKANFLADQSDLYVFVDGPRNEDEAVKVKAVQEIVKNINGFKTVHRTFSDQNIGCANSIIAGVTKVLGKHPAVIVLEDDIVTAPNFLNFMNQALAQYASVSGVFSVGGYTFPFKKPKGYGSDGYFFQRTCAWGWGIWADRWQGVDWDLTDFDEFMNDSAARKQFREGGSDRVKMLKRAKEHEIDAWDIRLCYHEFKVKGYTLYPTISKTINIGIDSPDSTTEVVYNRYRSILDDGQQQLFKLPDKVRTQVDYTRMFRWKFSVPVRAWNKLLTYAMQISRSKRTD